MVFELKNFFHSKKFFLRTKFSSSFFDSQKIFFVNSKFFSFLSKEFKILSTAVVAAKASNFIWFQGI